MGAFSVDSSRRKTFICHENTISYPRFYVFCGQELILFWRHLYLCTEKKAAFLSKCKFLNNLPVNSHDLKILLSPFPIEQALVSLISAVCYWKYSTSALQASLFKRTLDQKKWNSLYFPLFPGFHNYPFHNSPHPQLRIVVVLWAWLWPFSCPPQQRVSGNVCVCWLRTASSGVHHHRADTLCM